MSSAGAWEAVQTLAEPTRRKVFDVVRESDEPLTREAVATAAGISRRLAAFHLDLLVDAGLLLADYARPEGGRSGPGAGRPAKRYRGADIEFELTVPARRYDLAACIFARAITEAGPGDARDRALAVAREAGEKVGRMRRPGGRLGVQATLTATADALAELGYEPNVDDAGCVRLRNCPFHAVADIATELVCGVNDQFVAGVLDGLGGHRTVTSTLDGRSPDCCVTVARR